MAAPFMSTFTLATELVITSIILYVLYSGYHHNKFPRKLAIGALTYEILFNISYMLYRLIDHGTKTTGEPGNEIIFAIIHGGLSLIMFVALVMFFTTAAKQYQKEINYFREHELMTIIFVIFWMVSIVSGILFYIMEYL